MWKKFIYENWYDPYMCMDLQCPLRSILQEITDGYNNGYVLLGGFTHYDAEDVHIMMIDGYEIIDPARGEIFVLSDRTVADILNAISDAEYYMIVPGLPNKKE